MADNESNSAKDRSILASAAAAAVENEFPENLSNGEMRATSNSKKSSTKPIEYKNGRKVEQLMFSSETYFKHKEKIPKHYYPLVQYLENVDVKYHNDNLFEDSPLGFPTRAQ